MKPGKKPSVRELCNTFGAQGVRRVEAAGTRSYIGPSTEFPRPPFPARQEMLTRHRRLAVMLFAAAPLLLAGCTDSTGNDSGVVGSYALTVFASRNVPASFSIDNFRSVDVFSGSLVLREDGSFTETTSVRFNQAGQPSVGDLLVTVGTFVTSGSNIILNVPAQSGLPATSLQGTIRQGVLTYIQGFDTYEYRRR